MHAAAIETVFNRTFRKFNTVLKGGAAEPLYVPASGSDTRHVIHYREDYASSALHEIAHWLIARSRRRRLIDYGYHYDDERDAARQRAFERLETRPQALEWILSEASEVPFRVSCDNFKVTSADLDVFRAAVKQEALRWLDDGLPVRAAMLISAFVDVTGACTCLDQRRYEALPV